MNLGGPLVRQKDKTIIGVHSFSPLIGIGAFTDVDFAIFTKISYFNNWITDITDIPLPTCE